MQPIIDGLGGYRSVTRLIDTYEKMTGQRPHYATWMRWLCRNPSRRMQPAVGTALAIAAAFEMSKKAAPAAAVADRRQPHRSARPDERRHPKKCKTTN